ncbi:MAG: MATE family efflux transporter [Enterocloster clostridioformis]
MTMGGAVLIAQYKGAGDKKGQAESFQMLALLSLVSSLLVTIVSLATYQPLFRILNVPADAYQDASRLYEKIICCGTVFVFGYNAVCSVLKGLGDSKSSSALWELQPSSISFWTLFWWALLEWEQQERLTQPLQRRDFPL